MTALQNHNDKISFLAQEIFRPWRKILLLLGIPAVWALLASSTPAGDGSLGQESQVNVYTTASQTRPAVSMIADGRFVVTWESYGSSGTDNAAASIQGQRFESDGTSGGSQFQVNTYTTDRQVDPAVAMSPTGGFVVVWRSSRSSRSGSPVDSIQAQRFDSDGTFAGSEFQVNAYTSAIAQRPAVAMNSSGDFVVVWDSFGSSGSDDDGSSIQARLFLSDGTPLGPDFQINTFTPGYQYSAAIAMASDGSFLVVWQNKVPMEMDFEYLIQGRRYSSDGFPDGAPFQISLSSTLEQTRPRVAMTPDTSRFAVTWQSFGAGTGTDTSDHSIQGRLFGSDGTPASPAFQVNTYTSGSQEYPDLGMDAEGDFLVLWHSEGSGGSDTSGLSIQAQRFSSDATPAGTEFQVNTWTTQYQAFPALAMTGEGDFVMSWSSYGSFGSDQSESSIQGLRFISPLFCDGFESGDTTGWSSSIP